MEKGDRLEGCCQRQVMQLGCGRYSLKVQPAGSDDGLNVECERRRGPSLWPASLEEWSCSLQHGEDLGKSGSEGKFTSSLSTSYVKYLLDPQVEVSE